MKKICYALAALAAIAAVSCQEKDVNTENGGSGKPGTLTATFASSATKVTYTETEGNALQPAWEEGDEIIGFDEDGNTYTLTVVSVDANGIATLSGTVPDGKIYLIYKSGAQAGDIQEKSLIVSYADQAGDKTMPAVMLADGEVSGGSCNFEFDNAGAIIGISALKGVPASSTISKITVTGANLSEGKVELKSGALALTATTKDGDAISTATLSGITTDANGTLNSKVYIAVPVGAQISKVSATVGTGSYDYTLSSAKTAEEGSYLYVKDQAFVNGALSGVFTVGKGADGIAGTADDVKVRFAKGNLQYQASTGKWRFADNQYTSILCNPGNNTVDVALRASQDTWIDLFGWGATGLTKINSYVQPPYSDDMNIIFRTVESPSGDETLTRENGGDWGVCMGEGWRTLSKDQWVYLFNKGDEVGESTVRSGKWVKGVKVCDVEDCIVIAPDECFNDYVFVSTKKAYTTAEWESAEKAGLVCFPPTGYRSNPSPSVTTSDKVKNTSNGYYWSSTAKSTEYAYNMWWGAGSNFTPINTTSNSGRRYLGFAVRLVIDVK